MQGTVIARTHRSCPAGGLIQPEPKVDCRSGDTFRLKEDLAMKEAVQDCWSDWQKSKAIWLKRDLAQPTNKQSLWAQARLGAKAQVKPGQEFMHEAKPTTARPETMVRLGSSKTWPTGMSLYGRNCDASKCWANRI